MADDNSGQDMLLRARAVSGVTGCMARFLNGSLVDSYFLNLGDATNPRLGIGGSSALFPSIKRNATAVEFRLADDSDYAPIVASQVAGGRPLLNRTTSVTLSTADSGEVVTNLGASGAVVVTLPTPLAGRALVYEFAVLAAQSLTVQLPSGVTLRDGAAVSAAAGTAVSSTVGNTMRIVSVSATQYVVMSRTADNWTIG